MPKKIRELKAMLRQAGWVVVAGGGKGSHMKWRHPNSSRCLTLSGSDGDDAQSYQQRDVTNAVKEVEVPKSGGDDANEDKK
jgi:predicted RNA binding protein YcfA (HicA-like mRNA interferase family)